MNRLQSQKRSDYFIVPWALCNISFQDQWIIGGEAIHSNIQWWGLGAHGPCYQGDHQWSLLSTYFWVETKWCSWTIAGVPCKCSSQISWRWQNDTASRVPLQWVNVVSVILNRDLQLWAVVCDFDKPTSSSWRHNWCEGARGTPYVWGEGGFWAEGGQESCSQASEGGIICLQNSICWLAESWLVLFKEHLSQAKQVSMIAGGTGITPMLQLVRSAVIVKEVQQHDLFFLMATIQCRCGWKGLTSICKIVLSQYDYIQLFHLLGASSIPGPRGHNMSFPSVCKSDRRWHTAQVEE